MKNKKVLVFTGIFSILLTSCRIFPCKHVDKNNDHKCDLCEEVISEHVDADTNHLCDICNAELSQHIDSNLDHICDYCNLEISKHVDSDNDHFCEYCSQKISDHLDSNNDHLCDICGSEVSKHNDSNNDHLCDECGQKISEHIDNNRDHKCDLCQSELSKCEDKNLDGLCDLCNAKVVLPDWVHQMPTISIETENGVQITSKEEYVNATISCENCENEDYEFTDVKAGVRGRGNTTWTAQKKPYRIKFDKKQKMLGSKYKSKSWTLLANYFDYSLVRNYVFYKLASQLDDTDFAPCFKFVELFLNNQYQGVYMLSDQIQVGDGKVDIDETFPDDGNTGYLLEINPRIITPETTENVEYFYAADGQVYEVKSPDVEEEDYLKNPGIYVDFIKNYLNNAIDKLQKKVAWSEITEIIDVNTFADGYIVEEIGKNTDCMQLSTYLVKDKDGKLKFGPVWDFDIGGGNSNYGPGNEKECPPTGIWASISWFYRLLQYDEFKEIVASKLVKYQPIILNLINELDVENQNGLYAKYGESFERNFVRWPILGQQVWQITEELLALKSNKEHIKFLGDWLAARNQFLLETYPVVE